MKLEDMSMKDLLALHNAVADKPANPKSFSTKGRLIARVGQIADAKSIDLANFRQPEVPKVTEPSTEPRVDAAEAEDAATGTKQQHGRGVGELARRLLMNGAGWPHAVIASMVNAEIPGAAATVKSVRWYAKDMRKKGAAVPERQRMVVSDSR